MCQFLHPISPKNSLYLLLEAFNDEKQWTQVSVNIIYEQLFQKGYDLVF